MLSDEQRAMRRAGVTATDVPALLGLSPWRTPLQVWCEKMGADMSADTSDDIDRGVFLEDGARRWYAHKTGAQVVVPGTLRHPANPLLLATPDGIAARPDGRRVLEIKMPSGRRGWGADGTDEIPMHYVAQVATQIAVLAHEGINTADVFAVLDGKPCLFHVVRDLEFEAMIVAAVERFWVDHVLPRRPPPVTEPAIDLEAAGNLYRRHEGEAKQWEALATEEQRWVRTWAEARKARQEAQRREQEAEAHLKLILGTAPRLAGLPPDLGIRSLTWRQGKGREEVDWRKVTEALVSEYANRVRPSRYKEIVAEFTTTKEGTRPLRVYETTKEAE